MLKNVKEIFIVKLFVAWDFFVLREETNIVYYWSH